MPTTADVPALPVLDIPRLKQQRSAVLEQALRSSQRYLESLEERAVAPSAEAVAALAALDEPPPAGPSDPAATLARLDTLGSPAAVASAGGRYFGFVVGGALPAALAANWLAAAWDQNAGMRVMAPGACAFEAVAARWLVDILGLAPGTHCSFTTCTTTADMTVLLAARRVVLGRLGWDVERQGLAGAPRIRVVVGGEVHTTMYRALAVLGLGREQIHHVPVDGQGRLRAGELPPIEGPTIVCVQAGNVNTGSFDPIAEVCERVQPRGAWVHVDGAFGAWAAASPRRRHLVAGLELADSVVSDGHKWLNTPYDCGLAFVRDSRPLAEALAVSAAYLIQDAADPWNTTLESSRRPRGLEVWAALHSLGRSGVEALVERSCGIARRFADGLRQAGHAVLNAVELNQVLVSFGDEARTRRVVSEVQRDGTCWASGTTWQGQAAMRISVSGWATTDEDVARSLGAILRIAERA